jgi:hypothetical protein
MVCSSVAMAAFLPYRENVHHSAIASEDDASGEAKWEEVGLTVVSLETRSYRRGDDGEVPFLVHARQCRAWCACHQPEAASKFRTVEPKRRTLTRARLENRMRSELEV